jgi:hypothetical protein
VRTPETAKREVAAMCVVLTPDRSGGRGVAVPKGWAALRAMTLATRARPLVDKRLQLSSNVCTFNNPAFIMVQMAASSSTGVVGPNVALDACEI